MDKAIGGHSDKQKALDRIQVFLNETLSENTQVLEVGCGSNSQLKFTKSDQVTGIDISKDQLERNSFLKNKILGDIQSYDFESKKYDLVICWDVLEHLKKPKLAILNMLSVLNHNGILVIKVPNLLSFKGLFTKFTPHFIHVFYYRKILGRPLAGTEDRAPFPTFLCVDVILSKVIDLCNKNGAEMEFFAYFTDIQIKALPHGRQKVFLFVANIVSILFQIISFNYIRSYEKSDYMVVFRKKK
jgi:SAM-dependent methyltransferase